MYIRATYIWDNAVFETVYNGLTIDEVKRVLKTHNAKIISLEQY